MTEIIAFTGEKGSGKDTAASVLKAAGYQEVKFAGGIKAMLRAFLYYQNVDSIQVERMVEGDLKEEPSHYLSGTSPRLFMQLIGTDFGRDMIHPDVWVNSTKAHITNGGFEKVVISDLRFPNEVDAVDELNGESYRIEREIETDVTSAHESEQHIRNLPVKGIIDNNNGIKDLHEEIRVRFVPDANVEDLTLKMGDVTLRVQVSFDIVTHRDWYEDLPAGATDLDLLSQEMNGFSILHFVEYAEAAPNQTIFGSIA